MSHYDHSQSLVGFACNNGDKSTWAINWNSIKDDKDPEAWDRTAQNFWLLEKIPASNDISSWNQLSDDWQQLITHTSTGLTLLDTTQSSVGDVVQIESSRTDIEQTIYANLAFMVAVHARSYGTIFSTLCTGEQVGETHEWVVNNDVLQARAKAVVPYYTGNDPFKSKAAATVMPGFLLCGGPYLPFCLTARDKLLNTADIIRLTSKDKVIHNHYSDCKYQLAIRKLAPAKQAGMKKFVFDLLNRLTDLEKKYLHKLYNDSDSADGATHFSSYNAGKFLQDLDYDSLFTAEGTYTSPEAFTQLSAQADENHDFFSGNGSSYVMRAGEETKGDGWDF